MSIAAAIGDTLQEEHQPNEPKRKGKWVPYLLMLPGMLWLAIFFVVPIVSLFLTSLQTRSPAVRWASSSRRSTSPTTGTRSATAPTTYRCSARSCTQESRPLLALAIGYPLAYAIAFKSGKFRNLLLVLVIAPFFVSFILRTIAWQILADEGPVVAVLRSVGLVGETAGVYLRSRSDRWYQYLQLPALHDVPIYASLERVDPRLIEASGDLYAKPFTGFRKVTWPCRCPESWRARCSPSSPPPVTT